MSLSGTRGLIRISKNAACLLQAAMVAERVSELEFYRLVTGRTYEGEYGERPSARRRGTKFENNLAMNNAARLRRVLAPLFGYDPEEMAVRSFAEEVPGPPDRLRAMRLFRTRLILDDLAAGRRVPDLLIEPQLRMPIGPGLHHFEYVSPDFMVLHPTARIYVPGELKSFIVRDGVPDRADLENTRRQAGAQIVALRAEARRVGLQDRVGNRALFIFAKAIGLEPADPFFDNLDAEVFEIERAAGVLRDVRVVLDRLRAPDDAPLEYLVDDLPSNFQDRCIGSCILTSVCATRHRGTARVLGDAASQLLGGQTSISRVAAIIAGAVPATPFETENAERWREAARILPRRSLARG